MVCVYLNIQLLDGISIIYLQYISRTSNLYCKNMYTCNILISLVLVVPFFLSPCFLPSCFLSFLPSSFLSSGIDFCLHFGRYTLFKRCVLDASLARAEVHWTVVSRAKGSGFPSFPMISRPSFRSPRGTSLSKRNHSEFPRSPCWRYWVSSEHFRALIGLDRQYSHWNNIYTSSTARGGAGSFKR